MEDVRIEAWIRLVELKSIDRSSEFDIFRLCLRIDWIFKSMFELMFKRKYVEDVEIETWFRLIR